MLNVLSGMSEISIVVDAVKFYSRHSAVLFFLFTAPCLWHLVILTPRKTLARKTCDMRPRIRKSAQVL
jgi:hypothetical protein